MNETALAFIKAHEGCRLTAYADLGGMWTCGWGSTGSDIHPGTVWTQEHADARLADDVGRFEVAVSQIVNVQVTDNQMAALVSFAYNLGVHALAGSTLLRLVNQRDFVGAAAQFQRWDRAGGREVPGLLQRRHDEADLFLT